MDRTGIIAVSVAILVLLIWQLEFAPKFMPPAPPPGQTASGSPAPSAGATAATSATPATAPVVSAVPAPSATPAEAKVPEKLTDVAGPAARYHFTNLGGGISRTELTGYAAESGSDVDLNEFGSLPIGALSEQPAQEADLPYTVTLDGNSVLCARDQPGGLSISKRFTLPASVSDAHGYRVMLDISFANHGAQPLQSAGFYMYVGSAAPIHQHDLPYYTTFAWYVQGGKFNQTNVTWFEAGKIPLIGIETHPERPVYSVDADKIGWAAIGSQFFTIVAAPQDGAVGSGVWAHRFPVKTESRDVLAIEGALRLPAFSLKPGQSVTQRVELYAGPKIYGVLKNLGEGQERILNFGYLAPVTVFLLNTMNWLHRWTGNYAVAIIILTLCIRGALWPIQNKSTASMRQMQELQPRMTELKEKYKDDPTRMNTEVMKLYKEYNVNPLAGCLPMFIQLPVFWGFYRMLGTAIELRNSGFLWVRDLSQPDIPFHTPGLSWLHMLPILMAVTMIAQMYMTPRTGDKSQQQMMMFMPLIFIVFCYNYASALALYITVGNLFSMFQMYVTRKKTAPAPVKAVVKRKNR